MKYLLAMSYAATENCDVPMTDWDPADVTAHIQFQHSLGQELQASGELVDAQGLSGPESARIVVADGTGAPVISDGPFPETKEFLAGYWIVDVDSPERALEIAAKASAAPGPGGVPLRQPIEVREIMGVPATES
ncbi:YciI family protein [Pedococcus sp. 5OH_020]|uniref:YciI family protein n=1 Tax=Pedococcus sp. 5OH_020 TaxID=2989814 RepID=UPI0022E9EDC8|nr:YciI family protein [Pedococcus sp. 5OH_020]